MTEPHDHHDVSNELDALLTDWHRVNRDAAEAGRDRLVRALAAPGAGYSPRPRATPAPTVRRGVLATLGSRYTRAAASLLLLVGVIAVLAPWPSSPAFALEIMVPDGGRLDAVDERGVVIGPCPLEHTDVDVDVSGRFARVTLRQRFHNDSGRKIEAVYTFPMSHRGAVDRMTMTIGDRVVVGEVKERAEARRVYEAARAQGYVASLLEQERPNIFTQSVANIEPNATIIVEISYVETVQVADGLYRFDFPMVVAPRYIPGASVTSRAFVPEELETRHGVILRGPAQLTPGQPGDVGELGALTAGKLQALLDAAQPIGYPGAAWWGEGATAQLPAVWQSFEAEYLDGAKEIGWLYTDGTGQINGRWFFTDPRLSADLGAGFSADTDQVPDASRITPMPVRPPTRAGHDIALTMTIDTGGPAIIGVDSELHEITGVEDVRADGEGPSRLSFSLRDQREIPNRDFLLTWRVAEESIEEAHFAHRAAGSDDAGFFTLMLQAPARVDDADLRSRELIFVLDSSGSMENQPIEKAKALMSRAIETMRPGDSFNVITFNNSADCLWDAPRPNTEENRRAARAYVDSRQGGGGTEMRNAVLAALRPDPRKPLALTPAGLADLPADGRTVAVEEAGRVRFVFFLSDGEVGNDDAIIEAVREHAGRTRMFTVAIGNSPNRSLLDAMASVGRGHADYLSLEGDTQAAVDRFVRRVERPVLTDIELSFDGVAVHDTIPPLDEIPDLFDETPIVIHGRYAKGRAGTLRLRGHTGRGRFERVIDVDLPEHAPEHDVIATIWARAKVDERMTAGDRAGVIALGEAFGIVTAHTSFVAVEKSRITIDGAPMLVAVPIEMPAGQAWHGTFGGDRAADWVQQADRIEKLGSEPLALEELTQRLAGSAPEADAEARTSREPRAVERDHEAGLGERLARVELRTESEPADDALGRGAYLYSSALHDLPGLATATEGKPATTYAMSLYKLGVPPAGYSSLSLQVENVERQVNLRYGEPSLAFVPAPKQTAPPSEPLTAYGAVTLSVQDTDVAQVLEMLSIQHQKTIVLEGDVSGTVSAPVGNMSFYDLLDAVTWQKGLRYAEEGNVIYVYPPAEMNELEGAAARVVDGPAETEDARADAAVRKVLAELARGVGPAEPRDADRSVVPEGTVTLSVVDTDLRQILEMLSIQFQTSMIATKNVAATITANLHEVPFLEALDMLLRPRGFGYIRRGSVFYVYTQDEIDAMWRETAGPAELSAERAVLLSVALAENGRAEAALTVAEWLGRAWPDSGTGASLLETLRDDTLPSDERAARLRVAARAARARIEAVVADHRRAAAAARVLAEPLWPLAFPDRFDDAARREAAALLDAEGRVLVTILFADSPASFEGGLDLSGLIIEGRAPSIPMLVGRIPARALFELACAETVRRIEPTR